VARQHLVSRFYPPREIASKFKSDDSYVQTYLHRGRRSSADDLMYLLDELNAYSHDLASATKLVDLHKRDGQVDHRAELARDLHVLHEECHQRQPCPAGDAAVLEGHASRETHRRSAEKFGKRILICPLAEARDVCLTAETTNVQRGNQTRFGLSPQCRN